MLGRDSSSLMGMTRKKHEEQDIKKEMKNCVQFNIFILLILVLFVNKMFGAHLMNFIRGTE